LLPHFAQFLSHHASASHRTWPNLSSDLTLDDAWWQGSERYQQPNNLHFIQSPSSLRSARPVSHVGILKASANCTRSDCRLTYKPIHRSCCHSPQVTREFQTLPPLSSTTCKGFHCLQHEGGVMTLGPQGNTST
jgi:hypothetical protein